MSHEVLPSHMTITLNSHALCMTKNITRISYVNTPFPSPLPAPSPRFSFANVLPTSGGAQQCPSLANKSVSEIHRGEIHTKLQGGVEEEGGLMASREAGGIPVSNLNSLQAILAWKLPKCGSSRSQRWNVHRKHPMWLSRTSSYQLSSLSGRRGLISNNAGSHASHGINSDSRCKLKTLSEVLLPFIASSLGYLLKEKSVVRVCMWGTKEMWSLYLLIPKW